MKILTLSILFSIFLIVLLSQPTEAYISVDINRSGLTLAQNCRDINCANVTEDSEIYCMVSCDGSSGADTFYRFNETLLNQAQCDVSGVRANIAGIVLVNQTYGYGAISSSNEIQEWNFSQIGSGSCSLISNPSNALSVNTWGGDYYSAERWIYWQKSLATDEAGTPVLSAWWADLQDLSLSNRSNNDTIYVGREAITKYVNTVNTSIFHISEIWGIAGGIRGQSIVYQDGTLWLYVLTETDTTEYGLFRVNLTEGEAVTPSTFANPSIQNTTYETGAICFNIDLTTSYNGTLLWFLDGSNEYNTSVTTAPLTSETLQYCTELTADSYNWYVQYIDSNSDSWSTSVIYFTTRDMGIIPRLSNLVSSFMGLDSSEEGGAILGLFLMLVISSSMALKFGGSHVWQIFSSVFIASLLIFWFIGLIPSVIAIPVLIGIGLLFAYAVRNLVLGGG